MARAGGGPALVSSAPGVGYIDGGAYAPLPKRPPLAGQAAGLYALISASADPEAATASIERFVLSEAAPADAVDGSRRALAEMSAARGPVELVFLDRAGATLSRFPLANLEEATHSDQAATVESKFTVAEWFPVPAGAAAVEIRLGATTLTRREASPNPPRVRLVSPNGGPISAPVKIEWSGTDADGDSLRYTVLYSPDDGVNWQPVIADMAGTSLTLKELGPVTGSGRGRFKVVASDGFRSAEDVSDGLVTVPDRGPVVAILSPGGGAHFAQGTTVTFNGTAFDYEELGLPPESLRWESDLDGSLGAGDEVMTRTLRPGTHRITLRAKDGAGNEGKASTTVVIEGGGRVPPDPRSAAEIERMLTASAPGGPSPRSSRAFWIAGAGTAGAILGLGGAFMWARRRRENRP